MPKEKELEQVVRPLTLVFGSQGGRVAQPWANEFLIDNVMLCWGL